MISLTLTNVKSFMSHLLLKETFDNFSFIEGEIITFNIFRIDGYIQKDFFDSEEEIPEYSLWKNLREFCFSLIKGKKTPLGFHFIFSLNSKNISVWLNRKNWDLILLTCRDYIWIYVTMEHISPAWQELPSRVLWWIRPWNANGMRW